MPDLHNESVEIIFIKNGKRKLGYRSNYWEIEVSGNMKACVLRARGLERIDYPNCRLNDIGQEFG